MPTVDIALPQKTRRLFYGWWIALISALCLFLGPIPIAVFSFGIFLKSFVQEFHSGRGTVSFARTIFSISALGLPFAGRLIDRFGPRKVVLPSSVLAGLILLSAHFCSRSIWQLYVFYLAIGIAVCGVSPVTYCALIAHWFDRHRGLALGVTMLGLGLGALVVPIAAERITANFGWRAAFELTGAATLVISVPAIAFFLKDKPELLGLSPDGDCSEGIASAESAAGSGMSWRETWHDSVFWVLLCSFIVVAATVQGCLGHITAILADRGSSAQIAALATSLFGGGVLAGRTVSGYLLDRFFAPRVAAVIFGGATIGIGLLGFGASHFFAFAAAFLVGLGLGAEVDLIAYLSSRYFGLRSFGTINSVAFGAFALAGGIGTYLMGAAFDATGSYAFILDVFCILTLIGTVLMLRLGPYRYQVRAHRESTSKAALLKTRLNES